jgi:hypothetical protein
MSKVHLALAGQRLPDEKTLAWFQTQPGAWGAATTDPEPVPDVMARYVDWLKALPWQRMFAA